MEQGGTGLPTQCAYPYVELMSVGSIKAVTIDGIIYFEDNIFAKEVPYGGQLQIKLGLRNKEALQSRGLMWDRSQYFRNVSALHHLG